MLGHGALGQFALGQDAVSTKAPLSSILSVRATARQSASNTTALPGRASAGVRQRVQGGVNLPSRSSFQSTLRASETNTSALPGRLTLINSSRGQRTATTAVTGKLTAIANARAGQTQISALPGRISISAKFRLTGGVNLPSRMTAQSRSIPSQTQFTALTGRSLSKACGFTTSQCIKVRWVVIVPGSGTLAGVFAHTTGPTTITLSPGIAGSTTTLKPNVC